LLENAAVATPEKQRIAVTITRDGEELVYSVRDGGPGVKMADRVKIFEPFYTTRLQGTGLGLAIAKRIVELHGGRIDVEDACPGGAIFSVRLPSEVRPALVVG
jgi:two-component system sensor histidine kinase FlrB